MSSFEFTPFQRLTTLKDCKPGQLVYSLTNDLKGPALVVERGVEERGIILLSRDGPKYRQCDPSSRVLAYAAEKYRVETFGEVEYSIGKPEGIGHLLLRDDHWHLLLHIEQDIRAYDFSSGKITEVPRGEGVIRCTGWRLLRSLPDAKLESVVEFVSNN